MISICTATWRRPDSLRRLLLRLVTDVDHPGPIEIVICDNATEASARPVVDAMVESAQRHGISLRYLHEPVQNISLARNRTVHAAAGEWLCFIDDDEEPERAWLRALFDTARRYTADVVCGTVMRRLPEGAPAWAHSLPDQGATGYTEGEAMRLNDVTTGNLLVRRSTLIRLDGPFSAAMGLRGGEDTLAFGLLQVQHGVVIRASPNAIVTEDMPPARCELRWHLRRAFRSGQTWTDVEATLFGRHRRAARVSAAIVRTIGIAPLVAVAPLMSSRVRFATLTSAAALMGQASGLLPYRLAEYK